MLHTTHFLQIIWNDTALRNRVMKNLENFQENEMIIDVFKLRFDREQQRVIVFLNDPNYRFANKVVPMEFTKDSLVALIEKDFDRVTYMKYL